MTAPTARPQPYEVWSASDGTPVQVVMRLDSGNLICAWGSTMSMFSPDGVQEAPPHLKLVRRIGSFAHLMTPEAKNG